MKTAYILACCLLVLAVVLDLGSKRSYSISARGRARCLTVEPSQQEGIKAESKAALILGNRLLLGGMFAAGLGLTFWLASVYLKKFDDKRLTPVVPLVLLIAYGMLFFMAV
jgi:hypothetical protein